MGVGVVLQSGFGELVSRWVPAYFLFLADVGRVTKRLSIMRVAEEKAIGAGGDKNHVLYSRRRRKKMRVGGMKLKCFACGKTFFNGTRIKDMRTGASVEAHDVDLSDGTHYDLCPKCMRLFVMSLHMVSGDDFPFWPEAMG